MIKYVHVTKEDELKFYQNKAAFRAAHSEKAQHFTTLFDGSICFVAGGIIGNYFIQYLNFLNSEKPLYFLTVLFFALLSAHIGIKLSKLVRLFFIYLRSTNRE